MKALGRIENQMKKEAKKIVFEVVYIPGTTEDLDMYEASHEGFNVSSFGPTKEKALASARTQLEAIFLKDPSILKKIK